MVYVDMNEVIRMKKYIIINACNGCPNIKAFRNYYCGCIEEDTGEIKIIENIDNIPKWCPLNDYKE